MNIGLKEVDEVDAVSGRRVGVGVQRSVRRTCGLGLGY